MRLNEITVNFETVEELREFVNKTPMPVFELSEEELWVTFELGYCDIDEMYSALKQGEQNSEVEVVIEED